MSSARESVPPGPPQTESDKVESASVSGVGITLYATVGCAACSEAQGILRDLGLKPVIVSLDRCLPAFVDDVLRLAEGRAVAAPLIFVGGFCVGGGAGCLKGMTVDKLRELAAAHCDKPAPPLPKTSDLDNSTPADDDEEAGGPLSCELDEAAAALEAMRLDSLASSSSVVFGTHWRRLWPYRSSFTGAGFASWAAHRRGWDSDRARRVGALLLSRGLCRRVYGDGVDKSVEDELRLDDSVTLYRPLTADWLGSGALNGDVIDWRCRPPDSLAEVGERLRSLMLEIQALCISEDGRSVNYGKLADSKQFAAYCRLARRLQRVNPEAGSRDERLAFFINIYNSMVLHAKLVVGPPTGLWSRYRFFAGSRYIIGGRPYSLLDIEHGILRANRRGPGLFRAPFSRSDPRRRVVPIDRPEPLVHFALNCGARGCPPIRTYRPNNLSNQLLLAGRAYLSGDDAVQVRPDGRGLALSALFRWYANDFVEGGDPAGVAAWAVEHMPDGDKRTEAEAVLRLTGGRPKISYLPYDWGHNQAAP